MVFVLMHKDVKVLKFELSPENRFRRVLEIYDASRLPFSTDQGAKQGYPGLAEWWADRCIPVTRDEYANLKASLPDDDSFSLAAKSHGLSVDDQYWIKREDEGIAYDDVSFFSNRFSEDIGDIMVGTKKGGDVDYRSPDSTLGGNLKKRWKRVAGKTFLLKAGSKPYQYEIFNEIIASKVMTILGIEHVDYEFVTDNGQIYCSCPNFVSYNEDLVTAYQLRNSKKQRNDASLYQHLLSVYETLGIPDYKTKLDQMLFIDYLLGNVDRHLNNFGVIRDAKTLEFLRMAPVFDTGSCLGFDVSDAQLESMRDVEWKPFESGKCKDQLDLIADYSWLDADALRSIPKEVDRVLRGFESYVSRQRREAALAFLVRRVNQVLGRLGVGKAVSYNPAPLTSLEKRVLEYIKDNGGELDRLEPLMELTGSAYITVYRAVSSLTDKGFLVREGSRKTGRWTVAD